MENKATITLDGVDYPLLLTTRAVREIGKKYGGLDKIGEEMMSKDDPDKALDIAIWMITLLANQPILIFNRAHKGEEKPLLTVEDVELLTTPADLGVMQYAVKIAMSAGMKREIFSEKAKNA